MRELHIQKNDADQRVDKFLGKTLKQLPKSLMYKYIRNKKIKVNKKRCEISQRLVEGDTMQLYIAEEFFDQPIDMKFLEVSDELTILYEDTNILILDKEKGLLAHSDEEEVQDNLIDRVKHYLYEKKEYDPSQQLSFAPSLCHRIDRNTQGIVIAAKTASALREVNSLIKNRDLEKKYMCICEGNFIEPEAVLMLYHKKVEGNKAMISNVEKDGYQKIITAYKVVAQGKHHALLEIDLKTGKSHQIRAVMGYLKHPLLGDVKYGAKKSDYAYQALCAYKVTFHNCSTEETIHYLHEKTFELQNVEICTLFKQKYK